MRNKSLLQEVQVQQRASSSPLHAKDDGRVTRNNSLYETALEIASLISEQTGTSREGRPTAYLTGGWVRDKVLGKPCLDIDMEVLGISKEELIFLLKERLPYGIISPSDNPTAPIKIIAHGEAALDITIPMRSVSGHSDGGVAYVAAPDLSLLEACKRRDFTCNSIYFDPLKEQYIDPVGGIEDLARGVLRLVPFLSEAVIDSGAPLRACRFMAQHGLTLDPDSATLLIESVNRNSLLRLPKTFITKELRKLLCECDTPSRALRNAESLGVLQSLFPELAGLRQIPQDSRHHPEGDALEHTMLVTDAAATLSKDQSISEKFKIMLAALLHDVGKLTHTQVRIKDGQTKITAHGHESASAEIASRLLKELTMNSATRTEIVRIVANHMRPLGLESRNLPPGQGFDNQVRQLVRDVHPANFGSFLMVCRADKLGRAGVGAVQTASMILGAIEESAIRCEFLKDPRSRLLKGVDLSRLGFSEEQTDFGVALRAVETSRDAGSLITKEDAERFVLKKFALNQLGREFISQYSTQERSALYRALDAGIRSGNLRHIDDISGFISRFPAFPER